jgi:SAM-dependent methyltransferase
MRRLRRKIPPTETSVEEAGIPQGLVPRESDLSFDELGYLSANPDVAREVEAGNLQSGYVHYRVHGETEGRPLEPQVVEHRDRERALAHLKRDGKGLEIGPSHNPLAPKSAGFDVDIVDHLDRKALIKKYLTHGIDLRRIEEVDYISHGEPLAELTGHRRHYDWVLASHVFEHVPNPIGFLSDVNEILRDDGVLSMVVPHKARCFDYFLPTTTTGALLDAWLQDSRRPSPGQIFDHFSSAALLGGALSWDGDERRTPDSLAHVLGDARKVFEEYRQNSEYVDVHCWRFTPATFRLILFDLAQLGVVHFEILGLDDPGESEFYVSLRPARGGDLNHDDGTRDRFELLRAAMEQEVGTTDTT